MAYDPTDWSTADDTAKDTAQHFFTDSSGAHVTETAGDPTTGNNVLIDSGGMYVRDGTTVLAQFKDPTVIGQVTGTEANIRIGNVPNWGAGIGIFEGNGIGMLLSGANGGGVINSSQGAYIILSDGIGVNTFGGTPFNVLDSNRQSGFCIGGYHVYCGSTVRDLGSSSVTSFQIWSNASFCSTFNVSSGNEKACHVFFNNKNYSAGNLGVIGAEYRTSGWYAHWTTSSSGNKEFGYLVLVPDSRSTV